MGNNRYHAGVRALAMERPGVLTLHDVVLHHLLLDETLGQRDYDGYERRLAEDHGWVGEAAALGKRWGAYGQAPVFALPAHRTLLRRQRGVLVHSAWAAAVVREDDPELCLAAVPMGIPLPKAADREAGRALRRRFGLPEDAPVAGSVGFQTPIKRTEAVIPALAAPGLERLHLLVVGEVSPYVDLEGAARRAGVADRVRVTGFVDYADFEAAIAATDLCLNLRYPTAGETSASLLRVLAAGRPAVVSDYGQFGELPAEVALRVPLGDGEGEALAAALRGLLGSPERLRAMGGAAREHVRREHDPERAAAAVVAACRAWRELPPLPERPSLAPPPSSLIWDDLGGTIEVEGADLPWPPGERRRLRVRLANRGFARWLAGESGPGGVALAVRLFVDGPEGRRDLLEDRHWPALQRDLHPGGETVFETEVRRPAGPATLRIEPHVLGWRGMSELGGPSWERVL
jgi:glycosyltransferase involved in cell wall biosynthesis